MTKFYLLKKNLFFIISFLILFGSFYFFINFKEVIAAHDRQVYKLETDRAYKTAIHIKSKIIENCLNINQKPTPKSFEKISNILSYFVNDEFRYVYIVKQEKDGFFRYIADGSSGSEKADFKQKFMPVFEKLWNRAIKDQKDTYELQSRAEGIWLTYLSPSVVDGHIKCILVLDISIEEYQKFNKLIVPLSGFLNKFLLFLFIVFLVVALQGVLFYNQYKNRVIDSLTKLYNRHYLSEIIKELKKDKISIMMIDIDYFKAINDKYGHVAGDTVLASIAKKIVANIRVEDIAIRYGGEEFLIIVKSKDKIATSIAKRIRENIYNTPIRINEKESIKISVSIGLNLKVDLYENIKDAIKKADEMLYQAKQNGRNRVEIFGSSTLF